MTGIVRLRSVLRLDGVGGSDNLKASTEGENTLLAQEEASLEEGEIMIGPRSYVLGENAVKVATKAGEAGK